MVGKIILRNLLKILIAHDRRSKGLRSKNSNNIHHHNSKVMDNKGFLDTMESSHLSQIFEIAYAINKLVYPRKIYNVILSASSNKSAGLLIQDGVTILEWDTFEDGCHKLEMLWTKMVHERTGINPHHLLGEILYTIREMPIGKIIGVETPEHIGEPCFKVEEQQLGEGWQSMGQLWLVSRIHLERGNPDRVFVKYDS